MNLLNEYKKVTNFENAIANYTGSPYAICVDSCTNALLLCFLQCKQETLILPKNTYIGVMLAGLHANKHIQFEDTYWTGIYNIKPTNIYDAAKRLTANMYIPNTLMCLSFHYKKHLKIGRGGAILTDNKNLYNWFITMRNNGKNINFEHNNQTFIYKGYNMLLHPDLAEKGLSLLKQLPEFNEDLPWEDYGDLSVQAKALI